MAGAAHRMISFRRVTCKLAGFGSALFSGAEYRISGRVVRLLFIDRQKLFS
jgi:hypothetical protein